jgi:hypothetical protein
MFRKHKILRIEQCLISLSLEKWRAPKLLKRPKGGSQSETMEEEENWDMLPNS